MVNQHSLLARVQNIVLSASSLTQKHSSVGRLPDSHACDSGFEPWVDHGLSSENDLHLNFRRACYQLLAENALVVVLTCRNKHKTE